MNVLSLGHLVLNVRDLERAVRFYEGVLGLRLVARAEIRNAAMAFFSISGNHHDLALREVGRAAPVAPADAPGLAHFALKIGDDLEALRAARAHLQAHGVAIDRTVDHKVSQSHYVRDPDGNMVELYVDADPAIWRTDPASVAHSVPFDL